ncbi:hypothetical protein HS088_TW23G00327 [Tripterygium wilfordii]|uniref:xyloglucan:xyloglucosyl transferase n=1 Tax=Tripterygium wilfordii TaxID=458696 RepID=A0A7J7BUM3_TRIWF|nr:hypothetical protein HS088_TW23G00327 [Tripterygium wilfordii]
MGPSCSSWILCLCFLSLISATLSALPNKPVDVPFARNYAPTWAFDHIKYFNGGSEINLMLDKYTGTGFQSKGSYLFGHFSMHIKMVPGDSAGTVTAFYGKRWWDQKQFQDLTPAEYSRLQWVRQRYTIYNYCTDRARYPTAPPECKRDHDI